MHDMTFWLPAVQSSSTCPSPSLSASGRAHLASVEKPRSAITELIQASRLDDDFVSCIFLLFDRYARVVSY